MSSLSVINPPDRATTLERALLEKIQRVQQLEDALQEEKKEHAALRVGLAELRVTLSPLYQALQMVFGHLDAMNSSAPVPDNSKREVWESWKQKLGGLTANAIDILFLHGPMNQTQLRIQLKCAQRSVQNVVAALNRAGLINKANGKISLKEI
jgi:hypothetical protein